MSRQCGNLSSLYKNLYTRNLDEVRRKRIDNGEYRVEFLLSASRQAVPYLFVEIDVRSSGRINKEIIHLRLTRNRRREIGATRSPRQFGQGPLRVLDRRRPTFYLSALLTERIVAATDEEERDTFRSAFRCRLRCL